MSEISYHDSVSVETEVKSNDDLFNLNINCFQFFGLSEKAIQTDLTLQDILKIDFKKKQINYNNNKQDPLMAPSDYNELNNKKQISNKLINSNKSDNYENKNKDLKGKDFFDNCKVTLSKIFKKGKKEEKSADKNDKDNFLDKKRKRDDEEKQSPSKNKNKIKIKDINKLKDKEKIKHKIKSLNEKNIIKKQKEEKSEKNKDKKEKSAKKNDQVKTDIKQDISDIQNILGKIIDDSVVKSTSKNAFPKVDAYSLFKKEYMQYKDVKENSENTCQSAWNKISKEMKKFYNLNAIRENKMLRIYFNKLKLYRKKKDNESNEKINKSETKSNKEEDNKNQDK